MLFITLKPATGNAGFLKLCRNLLLKVSKSLSEDNSGPFGNLGNYEIILNFRKRFSWIMKIFVNILQCCFTELEFLNLQARLAT